MNLIYSPNLKIPIGEPIRNTDGSIYLRVKNTRTNMVDNIPLEYLLQSIILQAKSGNIAETRIAQGLAAQ